MAVSKPRRIAVCRLVALLYVATLLFVSISSAILTTILWTPPREDTIPKIKVVIHPSSCEEGPTSNIYSTSLLPTTSKRRRGEYPYYHHISQIVEGPALVIDNVEKAICKIRPIQNWYHWPQT
jgi:hypothetical protein